MNLSNHFPIFVDLMLKCTVILAGAALLVALLRGASAAVRDLIWMSAFSALLVLPLTKALSPRWSWQPELPGVAQIIRIPADAFQVAAPFRPAVPPIAPAAPPRRFELPSWRESLLAVWIGVAVVLLSRRALAGLHLRRLRPRTQLLSDPRLLEIARSAARESCPRRRLEFRQSPWCRVPVTWGVVRPVVMLPADAAEWPEQRLLAAFRHELAHVRRSDALKRLLAQAVCAFYWPNPLIWLAARALHAAQEQSCDDLVLSAGMPAADYALQLVEAVKGLSSSRSSVPPAVAMAHPSTLETRVRAIVDDRRDRRPAGAVAAAVGVIFVACVLGLSAVAQVRAVAAAAAEKPDAAAPPADAPIVEIDSKFVEISTAALGELKMPELRSLPSTARANATSAGASAKTAFLTAVEFEALLRSMNKIQGVDVLSSPRVATKSGQRAVIEIIREFRYPIGWEKGVKPGTWKPNAFETKNLGVTLEVTPKVGAGGLIGLQLAPKVVRCLGLLDLEDQTVAPAKGRTPLDWWDDRDGTVNHPPGHRLTPLFSERKEALDEVLKTGQTLVVGEIAEAPIESTLTLADGSKLGPAKLSPADLKKIGAADPDRNLWVLITAKLLPAAGKGAATPEPEREFMEMGTPGFLRTGKEGPDGTKAGGSVPQ